MNQNKYAQCEREGQRRQREEISKAIEDMILTGIIIPQIRPDGQVGYAINNPQHAKSPRNPGFSD
jgi:hypothetical protein